MDDKFAILIFKAGFTMIELLIVVGIILLVIGLGSPVYRNLMVSTQLNDSSDQIVQMIRTARDRSVARKHNSSHGIYLGINNPGDDRVVIYQGSSYAGRDQIYDQVLDLGSAMSLSTTIGGNEVKFTPGTGDPDKTGIVTITHNVSGSRSMTINQVGLVD